MVDLCNVLDKITGCDGEEIVSKDPKARYSKITIPLDTAISDKEFHLAGSFIAVASVTGNGTCEIKLDYIRSGKLDLRLVEEIKANFSTIYITSNGGGGICTLYICQAMETALKPASKAFLGITFSYKYNTENYVRRLHETTHRRMTQLLIRNTHAVNGVDLGYFEIGASADDFRGWAWRLVAQEDLILYDIDMYDIGYCSTVDDAAVELRVMGIWLGK